MSETEKELAAKAEALVKDAEATHKAVAERMTEYRAMKKLIAEIRDVAVDDSDITTKSQRCERIVEMIDAAGHDNLNYVEREG